MDVSLSHDPKHNCLTNSFSAIHTQLLAFSTPNRVQVAPPHERLKPTMRHGRAKVNRFNNVVTLSWSTTIANITTTGSNVNEVLVASFESKAQAMNGGGTGYVRFDIRITSCCPPGGLTDDGRTECWERAFKRIEIDTERGPFDGTMERFVGRRWDKRWPFGQDDVFWVWIMLESHGFNESQLLHKNELIEV